MYQEIDEKLLLFSSKFIKQKEYWLNKLSGNLVDTHLLIDHKHLKPQKIVERMEVIIPDHLCRQIIKLSKNSDLSIYIILLAGLKTLIYRSTFIENITVLSPIYKLNISQDTINHFLCICTRVDGDMTFKDIIIRIRDSVVEAYKNQDYPFKKILESLSIYTQKLDNEFISNIECTLKNIHKDIKMDDIKGKLSLSFIREENRLKGDLLYNPGFYKEHDLKQVSKHFLRILAEGVKDVNVRLSDISFLSAEEKKQLLIDFNNTKTDFPRNKTINRFIENQAGITPDRIAVGCGSKEMTYRELDEEANGLARLLREVGIGSDRLVGILLDRSDLLAAGVLGVWKAGGAYIPIDPEYPTQRILAILRDSRVGVLISDSRFINSALEQECNGKIVRLERLHDKTHEMARRELDIEPEIDMNSLAYVIYTSGSTGRPKGVMIEHIGMMNHIHAKINTLGIAKSSIVAQNAAHTFDISVWQLFAGLTQGAKTVIYPNEVIMDPDRFLTAIEKDQITILEVVPSYLSMMLDSLELKSRKFEWLHYLLVTGEVVKPGLVTRWFKKYPGIKMVNAYGPTEASDDITHYMMDEALARDRVSIGKPIQNLNIYIVDKYMNLLPVGVRGEICVSGVGVGRGYLNNVEKTSRAFMQDPLAEEKPGRNEGTRLYKTGDLGCWRSDGKIEALTKAYNNDKQGYCAIGSVKTNVGHLDSAAGVAGFIKTVLALEHQQIPPSLNFTRPNPMIDFEHSPFYVNTQLKDWKNTDYPLRAGVSSFGIGGTNAHVILEEAPMAQSAECKTSPVGPLEEDGLSQGRGGGSPPYQSRQYQLILLSARTQSALDRMTVNLAEFFKKNPGIHLADAAYTLQVGRGAFEYRKMLVCADVKEAAAELASPGSGKVKTFQAKPGKQPVVFMFSGQGSQYVNMALDIYRTEPAFREEMDRCFEILEPLMGYDIKEILYPQHTPPFGHPSQEGNSQKQRATRNWKQILAKSIKPPLPSPSYLRLNIHWQNY